MMKIHGFTLIELVVGIAILGGVSLLLLEGFSRIVSVERSVHQRTQTSTDSIMATRLIERVGRVAQLCRKQLVGGQDVLECQLDFSRPSSGVLQWVRFLVNDGALEYQWDTDNTGIFSSINTRLRFENTTEFVVCDDSDMDFTSVPPGQCPILPQALSTFHTANLLPAKVNRYFRFQLTSQVPLGGNITTVRIQSAFFRRNPTPFLGGAVVYQW